MKNAKVILIILTMSINTICYGDDITVSSYDSLVNTQYSSGDVVTFTNGFTSEGNIGNLSPDIASRITFEGNNYVINGDNTYSGFIVSNLTDFNNLDMSYCKGQNVNNSSYAGAILNNGGNVYINYSGFRGNFADASGVLFTSG